MDKGLLAAGALQGTIIHDPNETWSLATVVTLCGLHRALPIAAGRFQLSAAFQRFESLRGFSAALLRFASANVAKHNFTSLQQDPLPLSIPKAHNVLLDTRGMWKDSFEATSWAYKHLFTRCRFIHEAIVIQVYADVHYMCDCYSFPDMDSYSSNPAGASSTQTTPLHIY